jgi:hypothetical protein
MTKPLFNARLLAQAQRESPRVLDDEQRRIVAAWSGSAASGALLGQKEKPLQGQFLSEVFDRLLGYRLIVGAEDVKRARAAKVRVLERELSDLTNQA